MKLADFKQVGYFHFGGRSKGDDATGQLDDELKKAENTLNGDALIVLPEAFNVSGDYSVGGPHDATVLGSLINLSKHFKIAFVAGLMEGSTAPDRFNTAVLIDDDIVKRLATKSCQDHKGKYVTSNYQNPQVHRGITVAALICIDACEPNGDFDSRFSRGAMILRTAEMDCGIKKLLCVPCHTGFSPDAIAGWWTRKHFDVAVVANSMHAPSSICRKGLGCKTPTPAKPSDSNFLDFCEL